MFMEKLWDESQEDLCIRLHTNRKKKNTLTVKISFVGGETTKTKKKKKISFYLVKSKQQIHHREYNSKSNTKDRSYDVSTTTQEEVQSIGLRVPPEDGECPLQLKLVG